MSAEGIAMLEALAIHDGYVRVDGTPIKSDIIRVLLKEAIGARMAKGWKPKE
jgi:hypothetical protein